MKISTTIYTLAIGALSYLGLASATQAQQPDSTHAGEIKEHRIGKAYGITAEQCMALAETPSFTVYLNDKPITIPTKDFIQRVLNANIVDIVGVIVYNNDAVMGAENEPYFKLRKPGLTGSQDSCYIDPKVLGEVIGVAGIISNNGITLRFKGTGKDIKYDESFPQQGIDIEKIPRCGLIAELSDRVFPPEVRAKRNDNKTPYIDQNEVDVLAKVLEHTLDSFLK